MQLLTNANHFDAARLPPIKEVMAESLIDRSVGFGNGQLAARNCALVVWERAGAAILPAAPSSEFPLPAIIARGQ
jgi:hypothetical protein